FGHRCQKRSIK
ncbi:catalase family protein, partial [Vibrio parahaemolyticus V-223/04]